MRWRVLIFITCLLIAVGCSGAQSPTATQLPEASPEVTEIEVAIAATDTPPLSCDQMISGAIERVGSTCDTLGRNQICYGNRNVEVEYRGGDQGFTFADSGDILDLASVGLLRTAPFNEQTGDWGIAVIKAQANLEDAMPGQNVTFLLFGDTEIENPTADMQAVRIRTGFGSVECEGAPPAAVMIQSPNGQSVSMNINGAEITLASTVLITADSEGAKEMTVSTVEGHAEVKSFEVTQTVLPGARVSLPVDEDLTVSGPPSEPEAFDVALVRAAPVRLLERPITLPSPIPTQPTSTPTLIPTETLPPTATIPPTATEVPTDTPVPPTETPTVSPTPCTLRADWTGSVTVAGGDTLSRIAQRAGVTSGDLQVANCIANPDEIEVGQTLRVPLVATATPTVEAPIAAPSSPNLRAEPMIVEEGQCTVIAWDAADATQIFFEGQAARPNSSREICPRRTQTYTLMTVYADGRQEPTRITIEVREAGTQCGNQLCERGEDANSCAADCGAICGNNICEAGESSRTCSADCPQ